MDASAALAPWSAVVALGASHGLHPAMGWPLVFADRLADGPAQRRGGWPPRTLASLGAGQLLALAPALLPFALLAGWMHHAAVLQLIGGVAMLALGLRCFALRGRSPARDGIRPWRLAAWSCIGATAHGAGLLFAPAALGLCGTRTGDVHAAALEALVDGGAATACAGTLVYIVAVLTSGASLAWLVRRGLAFVSYRPATMCRDAAWGGGLALAGAAAIASVA
jgi:hypothetical protein